MTKPFSMRELLARVRANIRRRSLDLNARKSVGKLIEAKGAQRLRIEGERTRIDRAAQQKNDVLFINWQKLVSEKAGNRIYRRPENPDERHESRVYFEDFVENTHANGVEIVFIIDECHLNVTEAANRDVISKLDPKICIHVSATPPPEVMAKAADYDSNVVIKHEDVVAQGLIKESIVTQTKEDLDKYQGEDEDHVLLKLAIEKRREYISS